MKNPKLFLTLMVLVYATVLLVTFINKANPYLWFDEAGQFWISKGLNHYADPLESQKGLLEVVQNNSYYNMDPGGFSILLHFWSKISSSYLWLRLLPFLFLTGTLAAFISLIYKWTKNLYAALLIGFTPLLFPLFLNTGLELRAFSMEAMGTVTGILALEKLKDKITLKRLLICGIVFSFFMTSRYSAVLVVFIYSLVVLYLVSSSALTTKQKSAGLLVYSFPVLATLACIYFFSLASQNPEIKPIFYLTYLRTNPRILFVPVNLAYLFFVAALFGVWLLRNSHPVAGKYSMLLLACVLVNVLFIALSFAGKHPWNPSSSRCISLFVITFLCFAAFAGECLLFFLKSRAVVLQALPLIILVIIISIRRNSFLGSAREENSYTAFKKIDISPYKRIYADSWESPSIRYLFEYGSLRKQAAGLYPDRFSLEKFRRHSLTGHKQSLEEFYAGQPKMNELAEYDMIIAPHLYGRGSNDRWTLIEGTPYFYKKK